jgi:DNA-binding response OmpR family regulator
LPERQPDILVIAPTGDNEPYVDLFAGRNFKLRFAMTLAEAVKQILAEPPDVVLAFADDESAAQTCEVIRALGDFPIVVTPQPLHPDVVRRCIDNGADLVLMRPVPGEELVERIRAVLRRGPSESRQLVLGELVIDQLANTVTRAGQPVPLSPTEFRLLATLAENAGRVVTNRELLTRVWGAEYADDLQYIRLYISHLRNKLEDDPARPRLILTHRGVGYRLAATSDGQPERGDEDDEDLTAP